MAKFKRAQIEGKKTAKRAEEESLRLQRKAKRETEEAKEESQRLKREAQRKLELASAELQVWSDNTSNDITLMENDNKTTYDETLTVTSLIEPLQPNKVQDKPCTSREARNLNFNQASTGTLPTTTDYKRQCTSFEANDSFKAFVSFPSLTSIRNPNQPNVSNPSTTIASISVNASKPEHQDRELHKG